MDDVSWARGVFQQLVAADPTKPLGLALGAPMSVIWATHPDVIRVTAPPGHATAYLRQAEARLAAVDVFVEGPASAIEALASLFDERLAAPSSIDGLARSWRTSGARRVHVRSVRPLPQNRPVLELHFEDEGPPS